MNTEQFIQGMLEHVKASATGELAFIQSEPPGRDPRREDVEMHNWYMGLSDQDQNMVHRLIYQTAEGTLYGVLMILDHKMFIEGTGEKGELELYYKYPTGERVRLNPSGNGLDLEHYFKMSKL